MYFINNFYILCNFVKWKVNIFNYLTVFYLMMNQEICYKRDILFKQFLYLSHAKNPTLNKIIENCIVDNIELQKYLLATGLLQDSIQQSLDMVVTDGLIMLLLEDN